MRSLLLCCLLATPAIAHDFWLDATPGAVGEPVLVRLAIGPEFAVEDEYPYNPLHIVRFTRIGPDGAEARFAGFTGQQPAGRFIPRTPGLWVIGYQSAASQITLEAAKFEEYLREEGLTHVLEWRKAKGEQAAPGKEQFFRNAKALVQVGEGGGGAFDRALGMPFELVARTDPTLGGAVVFEALVNGKPAPNLRIMAFSAPHAKPVVAQTDPAGRATLHLDRAGRWLVKAVNAQRTTGSADWRSDWASLTFEVKPR